MLTRNKDLLATLRAMLVAFFVAGIPLLGAGFMLAERARSLSSEERPEPAPDLTRLEQGSA